MALTLRSNGTTGATLVNASWWNDYYNLLTGAMVDQPVTLSYAPGSSGSTPTLQLKTNGNAPLLQGFNGATQQFQVDASGNVSALGTASFGTLISGNPPFKVLANGAAEVYGVGVINGGNGYAFLSQMLSLGGGAPGAHIWQGTTDPAASAQEGDLWVKV